MLLLRPPSPLEKVIPIGLLSLGTYLEHTCPGVALSVIDFRLSSPLTWEQVRERLAGQQADFVGISSLSLEVEQTLQLARLCKELFPSATLLVGGPLASVEYALLARLEFIDRVVVGEGEEILREVVSGTLHDGRKVLHASEFPAVDLNRVPRPDYSLIHLPDYFQLESHEAFQKNRKYVPLFTSRGCPFACGFCFHIFGRKVRFRDLDKVCAEVEYLVQTYGIDEIHIEDDVFNIDRTRALEFFAFLKRKGLRLAVSFPNGIIYRGVDDALAKAFKEGGVYRVCFGIETTSPRMMELIAKKHDLPALSAAIRSFRKQHILTHGFFITGFPTERVEDLEDTLRFIRGSSLHTFRFSRYVPFKGTPLYARFQEQLAAGSPEEINAGGYHQGDVYHSDIPAGVLRAKLRGTTARFYLRPSRILGIIQALDSRVLVRALSKAYRYFTTGQVRR